MIEYMALLGATALLVVLLIVLATSEPPRAPERALRHPQRSFPETSWSMDWEDDPTMNLY